MDKKYQIFISSTYKDLIPEREKVRDVILSMYQFPIGMEMFSAADEEQWEIIKETIDSSDYYVLIIGKRYGSVIEDGPDTGISYTEKEYRYARSIGLPILAYIKNDQAITADNVDIDADKVKKLSAFKDEVTKGREVKWFSTTDQLGTEVTLSLHKEIDRKKRPGWIRSDAVDIEKSLSEIIELSKQNRELQEENKKLTVEIEKLKAVSERKPILAIDLVQTKADKEEEHPEVYQRDDLIAIDEDGTVHLKLKKLSVAEKEAKFQPLRKSDIPLEVTRFISDQDIRDYNASLPSEGEIKKYLEEYRNYLRLTENGVPMTVLINNLGTAKATDVSVTIEFPDQVRVFECEEIIEEPEPKMPKMPEDIIEKAYKKAERERAFAWDLDIPGLRALGVTPDLSALIRPSDFRANSAFESFDIEDNIVEIEQKQGIVHTKFDYFPGAYIVPTVSGEFEAKVTLMCAEYEDSEETTIRFIVEE